MATDELFRYYEVMRTFTQEAVRETRAGLVVAPAPKIAEAIDEVLLLIERADKNLSKSADHPLYSRLVEEFSSCARWYSRLKELAPAFRAGDARNAMEASGVVMAAQTVSCTVLHMLGNTR